MRLSQGESKLAFNILPNHKKKKRLLQHDGLLGRQERARRRVGEGARGLLRGLEAVRERGDGRGHEARDGRVRELRSSAAMQRIIDPLRPNRASWAHARTHVERLTTWSTGAPC